MATAGSAVGLGNVWRFPYLAGENGGAAFMIIYIGCVILLGVPCMINEFIIGRHAQTNTARAYRKLSRHSLWGWVGVLGVFTGFMITGYYAVVAGWCLQYIVAAGAGHLQSGTTESFTQYFTDFEQNPWKPIVWTVAILALTHLVIVRGVQGGIEKASKFMMPTLFVLLIIVVTASCMLPGSGKGIAFLLNPDFSKVTPGTLLDGLGQAFFSLSAGMGCLCTYASYFDKRTDLTRSAIQIAFIDILVAVLAGLMIFPAAFSVGVNPGAGPSLVFVTLPNVFSQAFGAMLWLACVISVVFYALLALAALTSLISLHEVSTAFFHEEFKLSRRKAALIVTVSCSVIGAFCSLSLGSLGGLQLFGKSLFDIFDFTTGQILLPLGGFLTCLFVGWYLPRKLVKDEYTNGGTLRSRSYSVYLFAVRFVCPILILLIFLRQFSVL